MRYQPQFESARDQRKRWRKEFWRDVAVFLSVTLLTLFGIILILHFSIKYGW